MSVTGSHPAKLSHGVDESPEETNPREDVSVLKEGFLLKRKQKGFMLLQTWQKRYFFVDNVAQLVKYSSTEDKMGFKHIKFSDIHDVYFRNAENPTQSNADLSGEDQLLFHIQLVDGAADGNASRVFTLKASDPKSAEEWVVVLKNASHSSNALKHRSVSAGVLPHDREKDVPHMGARFHSASVTASDKNSLRPIGSPIGSEEVIAAVSPRGSGRMSPKVGSIGSAGSMALGKGESLKSVMQAAAEVKAKRVARFQHRLSCGNAILLCLNRRICCCCPCFYRLSLQQE